mgnify:CR=1 FL=1
MLVLECVPTPLAAAITGDLDIPTIGIGAGPHCDGQVLVMHDMLGVGSGRKPRFVRDFTAEGGSIEDALRRSVQIRVPVTLLEPGTLPETTFKARRVVDQRPRG